MTTALALKVPASDNADQQAEWKINPIPNVSHDIVMTAAVAKYWTGPAEIRTVYDCETGQVGILFAADNSNNYQVCLPSDLSRYEHHLGSIYRQTRAIASWANWYLKKIFDPETALIAGLEQFMFYTNKGRIYSAITGELVAQKKRGSEFFTALQESGNRVVRLRRARNPQPAAP